MSDQQEQITVRRALRIIFNFVAAVICIVVVCSLVFGEVHYYLIGKQHIADCIGTAASTEGIQFICNPDGSVTWEPTDTER